MATELGSAFISVGMGTNTLARDIKKAFGGAESSGADAGKSAGKGFGGAFGIAAAALGAVGIGSFFKSAVSGAADLEQSMGAIGSVFKGSAGQMQEWSQQAAVDVGLSANEFNELGTLIGSQLKNGGTAMDELAPKTKSLIGVGADLASMFGGTTSEAVSALSSALKGERDPIERYGVSLNQTKIDAEAAALGFKKVGGALSAEANQAATLSLIMKQTADAHGNFGRETDTLAHKQQVLNAQLANGKSRIGAELLPVVAALTGALSAALGPAIDIAVSGIHNMVGAGQGLYDLLVKGDFSEAFASAFKVEEDAGIVGFLLDVRGGFIAMSAAFKAGGDDITSSGFAGFMERFGLAAREIIDGVKGIFTALKGGDVGAATDIFVSMIDGAAGMRDGLIKAIATAIPGIIGKIVAAAPAILDAAVRSFSSLVTAIVTTVPPLLTAVLGMLPQIISTLLGMLPTLLAAGLELFKGIIQAVVQVLPQIVTSLMNMLPQVSAALLGMLPQIVTAGLQLFMGIVDGLVQFLPVLLQAVLDILPTVISTLLGMLPAIIDAGLELFLGVVTGILKAAPTIIKSLLGMLPQLVSTLIGMLPQLIKAAVQLFTGIVDALPIILPQLIGALVEIGPSIVSTLVGMIPMLFNVGVQIIQGLINGIGSMMGSIGRAVLSIVPEAIRGPFEDLLGIHSPSRVFMDYGVNIGQGLINGLDGMHGKIASSVTGLVTVPPVPSFGASVYTPAGAFGSGGAGMNAQFTINQVDDPIGTSHAVARRLQSLSA